MGQRAGKLEKTIEILDILRDYEWTTASTLANKLNVSERTVFRYLKEIDMAFGGYPIIESSPYGFKRSRTDLDELLDSRDEAIGTAAIMTSPYASCAPKSVSGLGAFLGAIQSRIRAETEIPEMILRPILKCFSERSLCSSSYSSKHGEKLFSILPLRLACEHGIHYLQVKTYPSGKFILLAIDKMEKVIPSTQKVDTSELLEALAFLDSAWGIMITGKTVVMTCHIDSDISVYFLRHPIHKSQELHPDNKGYELKVIVHNPIEFIRWIGRFGEHAKNLQSSK